MNIVVSAKNFDLTPSLKAFVEEKVGRLGKYWSSIVRTRVELLMNRHHRHGQIFVAYIWLELPGQDIRVTSTAMDMRSAIDLAYPRLERRLLRAKDRLRRR